jgi:hypothetical protein
MMPTTAFMNNPDGYAKFFLYGDTKERIPQHIRLQSEPTSTKKTEAGLR